MKKSECEGYIAQAIDKNTGEFKTSFVGDKEAALRNAKYYRSIGYNAKVFPADETYTKALNDNYNMMMQQREMQRNSAPKTIL
jgi:phosphopantetheinyl transferase (holo-ACP synthase)